MAGGRGCCPPSNKSAEQDISPTFPVHLNTKKTIARQSCDMVTQQIKRTLTLAVLLVLVGCGMRFDTRAPWRDEVEAKCLSSGAVKMSAYVEPMDRIDGPGACGLQQPLRVSALAGGTVGLTSRATMSCSALSSLDRWLAEVVEPASMLYYHQHVTGMTVGSYSCRNQDSKWIANISEHAFGNAVDVMGFKFSDGRAMTVLSGWKGDGRDQAFLREIALDACDYFTTVLAPGSDSYHANHIHIDLARHDTAWQRHVCQPKLQIARRIPARPDASKIAGLNYTPPNGASEIRVADVAPSVGNISATPLPPVRPIDPKTLAALPPEPDDTDDGDFKGVY